MKCFGLIVTACLLLLCLPAGALSTGPVAVSPGLEDGVAEVGEICPTFSWSLVEGATGYRVEVFEVLLGEDPEQMAEAVMRVEIAAPTLSWTPSAGEALRPGMGYVWYVQAVAGAGEGPWSYGRRFRVDPAAALGGMKKALRQSVEEVLSEEPLIGKSLISTDYRFEESMISVKKKASKVGHSSCDSVRSACQRPRWVDHFRRKKTRTRKGPATKFAHGLMPVIKKQQEIRICLPLPRGPRSVGTETA